MIRELETHLRAIRTEHKFLKIITKWKWRFVYFLIHEESQGSTPEILCKMFSIFYQTLWQSWTNRSDGLDLGEMPGVLHDLCLLPNDSMEYFWSLRPWFIISLNYFCYKTLNVCYNLEPILFENKHQTKNDFLLSFNLFLFSSAVPKKQKIENN